MAVLRFSRWYPKLRCPIFTTIRRHHKREWDVGNNIVVFIGNRRLFSAKIATREILSLHNIATAFLCFDTNTTTRRNALAVLQSFYKTKIDPYTKFNVYLIINTEVIVDYRPKAAGYTPSIEGGAIGDEGGASGLLRYV